MLGRPYSRLGFLVPIGLVFGYIALSSKAALPDRLFIAAGLAFGSYVLGLFGVFLANYGAGWLLGSPPPDILTSREALCGLLLITATWLAWQINRDETVADIASCVEWYLEESDRGRILPGDCRQAVRSCYLSRGDRDDFSEE